MDQIDAFFQRKLKLSHLRLLVMFASLGQVRLVAERLNVTQPAISRQLAELENGLGAPVLKRAGNRLVFTPLGETLLKRAREVLFQLEHARRETDALSSGLSGTLSIGAVNTVLPALAPELTLAIRRRAPNVAVSFQEATGDRLFPLLAERSLDLLFSRTVPPQTARGQLTGTPVLRDPVLVVCGRQHPAATRRPLSPADLEGMPWILPPEGSPTFEALNRWMHENRLSFPPGCVHSTSLTVNETLMRRHPFLGLMPRSLLAGGSGRHLAALRLPGARFVEQVWLFHHRDLDNPVAEAALACLPEAVAALDLDDGEP